MQTLRATAKIAAMKRYLWLVLLVLAPLLARADNFTVSCVPPTTFACVPSDTRACPTTEGDPIPAGTLETFKLWKPATPTTGVPPSATPGQDTLLATDTKCSFPRTNVEPGTYWHYATVTIDGAESAPSPVASIAVAAPPDASLLTAGTFSYCVTGTAIAPTMSAIGLLQPGLPCGPTVRLIGTVRFCQITRLQTDLIGWCPSDKTLATGIWARAAP